MLWRVWTGRCQSWQHFLTAAQRVLAGEDARDEIGPDGVHGHSKHGVLAEEEDDHERERRGEKHNRRKEAREHPLTNVDEGQPAEIVDCVADWGR